ncbi:MAG: 3-phosphoshikimate 1-carboxyvinyltransferase [Clostridium sp.]|uniref:3-phosphoshikimate 1-carboxyvinyltransferase n=1 Tax=Clostridium sp. TaxID=1506 RepID=UPI003040508F
MNKIIIEPRLLNGEIEIPSSKSLGHRGIISASLSNGISKINNVQFSKDIVTTLEIMKDLGAEIQVGVNSIIIDGTNIFSYQHREINFQCNESGSTIRFLIPIALVKEGKYIFEGKGKLATRPLTPYYEIFSEKHIEYETKAGALPLKVKGRLTSGTYKIRGDISSQFITGLLFSLPLLEKDSMIIVTTNLESKGYIDLTIDVLKKFGIKIANEDYKLFKIQGNQRYVPRDYYIEGDYSQGAFFLVAGAIGSDIKCRGLKSESLQGDKVILKLLKQMGCILEENQGFIRALPSKTTGIEIDASECPDLVPILAVLASVSEGKTRIVNAKRLRIKECDRLNATAVELNKLGARITELEDSLIINGVKEFTGGEVDSHNDHRIVMALSIAATRATGKVMINNFMAIEKSYPNFFRDYISLGGELVEFNNRD